MKWELEGDDRALADRRKRFEDFQFDPGNLNSMATNTLTPNVRSVANFAGGGGQGGGGGLPLNIPGLSGSQLPTIPPEGLFASMGSPGAAASGAGAATGSAAKGGLMGMLGKLGSKLDPNMLLLGGLSMLGGDDEGNQMQSFRGTGDADPVQALNYALEAIQRLGAGLEEHSKTPTRLRSSIAPEGPAPVSVPGIPFQIGGGMGRDPALNDPSLLDIDNSWISRFQPFQGHAQDTFAKAESQPKTTSTSVRRRTP